MFGKKETSFDKETTVTRTDEEMFTGAYKTIEDAASNVYDFTYEYGEQSFTNPAKMSPLLGIGASIFNNSYRIKNDLTRMANYVSEIRNVSSINDIEEESENVYNRFAEKYYRKRIIDMGFKTLTPYFINCFLDGKFSSEVYKLENFSALKYFLLNANLPRIAGFAVAELLDKGLTEHDIKKYNKNGDKAGEVASLYYGNKLGDTKFKEDTKKRISRGIGGIISYTGFIGIISLAIKALTNKIKKRDDTESKEVLENVINIKEVKKDSPVSKTDNKIAPNKKK